MDNEQESPPERRRRRPATQGTLRNHLSGRIGPLTSAILVFPLFFTYQIGILLSRGQNGVDIVTRALIEFGQSDLQNYVTLLAVSLAIYAAVLVLLRHGERFNPQAFLPTVLESSFYALSMGSLILFMMDRFVGVTPGLAIGGRGALDILVISSGAGLHEELIFRVMGIGVFSWLLAPITGKQRAWLFALVFSSLAFSLAHHIGPANAPFAFGVFVYRTLAGVFFALIYQVRGFAVAAWTHALYDVYVFSLE